MIQRLSPDDSCCVMTQIVMPEHTNGTAGVMFGGVLMQWIDVCAGVAAMRHAGGGVVTASIDRLDFITPVHLGEVVILQAQVNWSGNSSMEVGCRVETEDMKSGTRRYVTKAYLTFVAVGDDGKPRPVPPLTLVSDLDRERHDAGQRRRAERLRAVGRST